MTAEVTLFLSIILRYSRNTRYSIITVSKVRTHYGGGGFWELWSCESLLYLTSTYSNLSIMTSAEHFTDIRLFNPKSYPLWSVLSSPSLHRRLCSWFVGRTQFYPSESGIGKHLLCHHAWVFILRHRHWHFSTQPKSGYVVLASSLFSEEEWSLRQTRIYIIDGRKWG